MQSLWPWLCLLQAGAGVPLLCRCFAEHLNTRKTAESGLGGAGASRKQLQLPARVRPRSTQDFLCCESPVEAGAKACERATRKSSPQPNTKPTHVSATRTVASAILLKIQQVPCSRKHLPSPSPAPALARPERHFSAHSHPSWSRGRGLHPFLKHRFLNQCGGRRLQGAPFQPVRSRTPFCVISRAPTSACLTQPRRHRLHRSEP